MFTLCQTMKLNKLGLAVLSLKTMLRRKRRVQIYFKHTLNNDSLLCNTYPSTFTVKRVKRQPKQHTAINTVQARLGG